MDFAGWPFWLGKHAAGDRRSFADRCATDDGSGDWQRDCVNGEIYNHRGVARTLGPDVAWRGTSDTETLLQAMRAGAMALLERLKGMFAFAIYDAARGSYSWRAIASALSRSITRAMRTVSVPHPK